MVPQLSVFLQNRSGKLAAITRALSDSGVDICALSIADTTDFGILRMLVSDVAQARAALSRQNCIVSVNQVVVVAVPDEPGSLARVLTLMAEGNIDIEYMYSLIDRGKNDAYMVFRVSDEQGLLKLLAANGLSAVDAETIGLKKEA